MIVCSNKRVKCHLIIRVEAILPNAKPLKIQSITEVDIVSINSYLSKLARVLHRWTSRSQSPHKVARLTK